MGTFVVCMLMRAVSKGAVRTRLPQYIILVLLYISVYYQERVAYWSQWFTAALSVAVIIGDRLDRVPGSEVCKYGGRVVVVVDVLLLLLQHTSTKPPVNPWHRLLATENP